MSEQKVCINSEADKKKDICAHILAVDEPHKHSHGEPKFHDHKEIENFFNANSKSKGQSEPGVNDNCNGVRKNTPIITLRCHTGISGDMLLGAFASLFFADRNIIPDSTEADQLLENMCRLIMPETENAVVLRKHEVNGINGWQAQINLPKQHIHRTLKDINFIVEKSKMHEKAKALAVICFELLAKCEAEVHNTLPAEINFHEIGALDSILDICLNCELYVGFKEPSLVCSPLPMADGEVNCAHGVVPAPAPAVLKLLEGLSVRGFDGNINAGELVTPTGLVLLRVLNTNFGPWPDFQIAHTSIVYGQKFFPNTANGLIAAFGYTLFNQTIE